MTEPRKEVALRHEILRGIVGSTCHGTAIEGQDDRDEMGIFVEPPEYVCGLKVLDHYIFRSQPEGVRSGPGDLDLTLYSLRKFCRLAVQGNPSVLVLLWLPQHLLCTPIGRELLDIRGAFRSRNAGERFLGYLVSQRKALMGERTKKVSRPELVEKYGFDVKFAMHALRLGYQGIEYLTEGTITLPVPEPQLSTLRGVRGGLLTFGEALAEIQAAEDRLRQIVNECELEANYERVNEFLCAAHRVRWGW
jgi:predicted nucleotidyltransferase